MKALDELLHQANIQVAGAQDLTALEQVRIHFLGKKGLLTEQLKTLGTLSVVERPIVGQQINSLKDKINSLLDERRQVLNQLALEKALQSSSVDVSLSGRYQTTGSIHPITQTINELKYLFEQMGFLIQEGPEIEDDYHNFTALNVPKHHPARAMQDTFYFSDGSLLRTQMSPVQIHTLEANEPPLRMIAIGKVYRRDFDLTHTPMFHQIECLMVDKKVTFANLKGLLTTFLQAFFEKKVSLRFRPSYFPFTEPSAEVDIGCINCNEKGCRICKNTGFLEVLGCGMVHPNVLSMAKIDANEFRGFAFGAGVDRLTMLKYRINDLRALFENDIRFLKQF